MPWKIYVGPITIGELFKFVHIFWYFISSFLRSREGVYKELKTTSFLIYFCTMPYLFQSICNLTIPSPKDIQSFPLRKHPHSPQSRPLPCGGAQPPDWPLSHLGEKPWFTFCTCVFMTCSQCTPACLLYPTLDLSSVTCDRQQPDCSPVAFKCLTSIALCFHPQWRLPHVQEHPILWLLLSSNIQSQGYVY